jgi:hypothetical protein
VVASHHRGRTSDHGRAFPQLTSDLSRVFGESKLQIAVATRMRFELAVRISQRIAIETDSYVRSQVHACGQFDDSFGLAQGLLTTQDVVIVLGETVRFVTNVLQQPQGKRVAAQS